MEASTLSSRRRINGYFERLAAPENAALLRRGCFAANTAAELGGRDPRQGRGEVDASLDAKAVASLLLATLVGITVLARVDGSSARTKRIADTSGHENVVFHQTADPEVALVEFDIVGDTVRGPFRQSVAYLLRVRGGRVVLLREFVDTAALNELFQIGC